MLGVSWSDGALLPVQIATDIVKMLANFHRDSYNRQNYQKFLLTSGNNNRTHKVHLLIRSWEQIEPEIFGEVPAQMKFFKLYQKYQSLEKAIAQLRDGFQPSCLTHNESKAE